MYGVRTTTKSHPPPPPGAPLAEDLGELGDACLHLNVVAPASGLPRAAAATTDPGARAAADAIGKGPGLPVLVWVHGGSNTTGWVRQLRRF